MKIEFAAENKAVDPGDFPKLKLKLNEKARISIVETAPEFAYVHTLRKPVIDDTGKFLMETRTNSRGSFQVTANEFVGQHFCFGDQQVLLKNGEDAASCPTCEAARSQEGVEKPDRRFAMHVLQYICQPNSFKPQMPLSLRLVVWAFGDRRYNDLADMSESWKDSGGLRFRDIELGPCEAPEVFQKFKMSASPHSLWTSEEEYKALGIEIYKQNRVADLELCIARKITKSQASQDIAKVQEAYDIGNGKKPAQPCVSPQLNVDDLLDFNDGESGASETSEPEVPEVASLELGAVFDEVPAGSGSEAADADNVVELASGKKPAGKEKASAAPELDFEKLLSDLTS